MEFQSNLVGANGYGEPMNIEQILSSGEEQSTVTIRGLEEVVVHPACASRDRVDEIMRMLSAVYRQNVHLSERLRRLEERFESAKVAKVELSAREREIHEMRLAGQKEVEIAAHLKIAEGTVKAVERRVRRKERERRRREQQEG